MYLTPFPTRATTKIKSMRMADCLAYGTSGGASPEQAESCSNSLVGEFPEDADAWYTRARILQHQHRREWREAALRFVELTDATPDYDPERIQSIRSLLAEPDLVR